MDVDRAIKLGKKLSPKAKKKLQQAGDKLLELSKKVSPDIDEPELELGEWTGKHTKEGRKIYNTNKGWEASEYTIGVKHPQINGGELTHIPSIYGGKIVDQATAEQNIIDNGGKDPEADDRVDGEETNVGTASHEINQGQPVLGAANLVR